MTFEMIPGFFILEIPPPSGKKSEKAGKKKNCVRKRKKDRRSRKSTKIIGETQLQRFEILLLPFFLPATSQE
jgi:hypothetical protein